MAVVVIAPDRLHPLRRYWKQLRLPFPGIADPTRRVSRLYRQELKVLKLGLMPLMVLVDRQRHIAWVHYGGSMADIPAVDQILRAVQRKSDGSPPGGNG